MTRTEDPAVSTTAAARSEAQEAPITPEDLEHTRPTATFRANRWPLRVLAIVVVAGLVTALFLVWRASQPTAYAQLPVPTEAAAAAPAALMPEPASPSSLSFAASRAVEIYVPNANPDLVISTSVEALGGCRSVIDPPRNGPDVGGVFGCTDFAQPGTSSGLAVLAGHSSRKFDTAFNRLYVQGSALVGQTVYVRTESSGTHWLAYRIEHIDTPQQKELPYLTSVWGGDGSSTAGRLVLVTCQQNDDGTPATANYVAVAQFAGVA